MLLRRRHCRLLLRKTDGAAPNRPAHHRRALRSGRAGVDRLGPRHPRRHRDLVRPGRRSRDPDRRLLRGLRRRPRPLRARDQPAALRLRRPHRAARCPGQGLGTGKSRLEVLESLGLKSSLARCTGSRTASTQCACSPRNAGSTGPNARAASTRSSSTAPTTTTSCRRCGRSRSMTGPRMRRTFRYLAITLDGRAVQSGVSIGGSSIFGWSQGAILT